MKYGRKVKLSLKTFKIKHSHDFSAELIKARQIAEFSVLHLGEITSSSQVKQFGLKSEVSNQIIKKYGGNINIKTVSNVKLVVPGRACKNDIDQSVIKISCLSFSFPYWPNLKFDKINQIEIDNNYVYLSVTVPAKEVIERVTNLGVDLNSTGHVVVAANAATGKIFKFGKQAYHTHKKYKNMRRKLQAKSKYAELKAIKHREHNIVTNLNHKISSKLVTMAVEQNANLVFEDLKGITKVKNKKSKNKGKSLNHMLSSWSFYQLQSFVAYKAKLQGVAVHYIDPSYTSQTCSKCGHIGQRDRKNFTCTTCGHVDHADVNAAFNIANRHLAFDRFNVERDTLKGSTDTPLSPTTKRVAT